MLVQTRQEKLARARARGQAAKVTGEDAAILVARLVPRLGQDLSC